LAPAELAAGLKDARGIEFSRKIASSWDGYSYDVIFRSDAGVAARVICEKPDKMWQTYALSLDDADGWYADDKGAPHRRYRRLHRTQG